MVERFYSGREGHVVVREGEQSRPLDLRLDLDREGQARINWGRNASGSRLAVALLADAIDDDKVAVNLAEAFTARVVVMLPERWTMSRARVLSFVDIITREFLGNWPHGHQTFGSSDRAANHPTSQEKTKFKPDVGER